MICSEIRLGFKYSCIGNKLMNEAAILDTSLEVQQSVVRSMMKSKTPRNEIVSIINSDTNTKK